MPQLLQETTSITEAAAAAAKTSGRMPIQFISPGWGSSGYYSPQVLEQAVTDKVIPAGTHMYADHPTDFEANERPERSIRDLMAVTVEDARLAPDGALVGEVQVVPQWRELLETVRDAIGVSIRGSATDIVEGEAEGRSGGIIEGLVAPVMSVDFVTRAGRGGKILPLLESARVNRRALNHGVSEATVNDTREALQTVLRDTYGGDKVYVWVRDFDESTVWFEVESDSDAGVYGQPYTSSDDTVALTGDRTEVRVSTTYVPVRPGGTTPNEESLKENPMPEIKIDEAEHTRLVSEAGRVTALEERATTAEARATKAETELAKRDRNDKARSILATESKKASVQFSGLEERGLMADLPVTESGDLDDAAFTTAVTTAVAEAKEAAGHGRVHGFGGRPTPSTEGGLSESEYFSGLDIVKEA